MRSHLFKELLRKYREGKTSAQETRLIDDWYESFGEAFPPVGREQKKVLRKQLHIRIVEAIAPAQREEKSMGKLWFWGLAVAASTLIVAAVGFWIWRSDDPSSPAGSAIAHHYIAYEAERGKLKKLVLPDSTIIWLNAGAKICFSMPFDNGDERVVTLVEGEAFFDVMPIPSKPFIVHTDRLDTRVLGTSFTMKSYRSLDETSVSVTTGSVQVVNRDQKVLGILHQGQEVVYHKKNDTSFIRTIDPVLRDAWMNGIIYLSEVSFAELALVFQNVYDQSLLAGSTEVAGKRYSIQLNRQTRYTDVVQAICAIHRSNYRKEGNAFVVY